MKTLWLVRHAKSSWNIEGLHDIDRPLNERGYNDAHEMARRIRRKIQGEVLLISSPAIRAISTALIFSRHIGIDPSEILIRQNLYETGSEQYIAALASVETSHREVFMFGHNPVISETAGILTGATIEEMPTAGVVGIGFGEGSWKKCVQEAGKLVFYDFPKNIPQG